MSNCYRGANLIFSSQFSDICSVVHLTLLTVLEMTSRDFVSFSLSNLQRSLPDDFPFETSSVLSNLSTILRM
jgi:hypothetical protein